MTSTTNYQINLPGLPDSWNRLSSEELEEVNRLYLKRMAQAAAGDEQQADRVYKLKCFMLFLDLKVIRRTLTDEKGDTVFLFRRKGLRHLFERIPLRAWQVDQWISQRLDTWTNRSGAPSLPTGSSACGWGRSGSRLRAMLC